MPTRTSPLFERTAWAGCHASRSPARRRPQPRRRRCSEPRCGPNASAAARRASAERGSWSITSQTRRRSWRPPCHADAGLSVTPLGSKAGSSADASAPLFTVTRPLACRRSAAGRGAEPSCRAPSVDARTGWAARAMRQRLQVLKAGAIKDHVRSVLGLAFACETRLGPPGDHGCTAQREQDAQRQRHAPVSTHLDARRGRSWLSTKVRRRSGRW